MTPAPPYTKMPPLAVRRQCKTLLVETAEKHGVPPAFIVAHLRNVAVVVARKEVMLGMLELGLTRSQVAMAFGRDLRRVRASVIGAPRKKKAPRGQTTMKKPRGAKSKRSLSQS